MDISRPELWKLKGFAPGGRSVLQQHDWVGNGFFRIGGGEDSLVNCANRIFNKTNLQLRVGITEYAAEMFETPRRILASMEQNMNGRKILDEFFNFTFGKGAGNAFQYLD